MESFKKELYMRRNHLCVNMIDDPSDIYVFVFNSDTNESSDICAYTDGLEFELDEDGIYTVVTIRNSEAQLVEGGIQIGSVVYTPETLMDAINSRIVVVSDREPDVEEIICIWALRECLAKLELEIFRDLLKSCGSIKCKNSEIRSQRDFLFIAVWLIENYLELGDIEKAKMVYRGIQSCGSICKNLSNNNKKCGCNG